jgi:hypothetical protein
MENITSNDLEKIQKIQNSMQERKIEKKSFFKKKFLGLPLFAILILGVVMATTAVYVYLSNTSTINVNVTPSFQTWLGTDSAYSQAATSLNLGNVNSLNPIQFRINERNTATSATEVYNVLIKVTSNNGAFTGNEFDSIYLTDNVGHTNVDILPALKYIDPSNGNYASFSGIGSKGTATAYLMFAADGATLSKFSFPAETTHTSDITIHTNPGLSGSYTIDICTINNLVGADCQ